jgi:hypothetical protein
VFRVAASTVPTDVVDLVVRGDFALVKAVDCTVKHLMFWTLSAAIAPNLTEVTIRICSVADTNEAARVERYKAERSSLTLSVCQATFDQPCIPLIAGS